MPGLSTCRAFQRMATIFMSGFLFSAFKSTVPDTKIRKLKMYEYVNSIFEEMDKKGNAFYALGYDISLRHWIGESNKGSLEPHNPKPRAHSGG